MYQEETKGLGDAALSLLPDLKAALYMGGSAFIAWLVSRPKTKVEIGKTLADTDHTNANTIKLLLEEVDELVPKVRELRDQIEELYDHRTKARSTISTLISQVAKMLEEMTELNVVQSLRMKAVQIQEGLYHLRESLRPVFSKPKKNPADEPK